MKAIIEFNLDVDSENEDPKRYAVFCKAENYSDVIDDLKNVFRTLRKYESYSDNLILDKLIKNKSVYKFLEELENEFYKVLENNDLA
jgi:hypothetical protein